MSKIFSITLNSAIDHLIEIDKFQLGEVKNAKNSFYFPSGKAINSVRTISCLKEKITAFCFVGKAESHFYNQLSSEFVNLHLYPVNGITRSNITIVDSNHDLIIHAITNGYNLTSEFLLPFINDLQNLISPGDIVIMSGSLPKGIQDNYYKLLIRVCNKSGCKVVFDSRGNYFRKGLLSKPFAIKPNLVELQELTGKKISTLPEIVQSAKDINQKGIELVFVSMGSKGVILTRRGHQGYWSANVKLNKSKHLGDEIGCGDAMIGGIALSLSRSSTIDEILKMAVACGAANILSKGPGNCKLSDVTMLAKGVIIKHHKEL